jgi:hypothetical protein
VLVLRVEGPMAIEIQHLSDVVLERVNRFFGWRAVGGLRLRQAPLRRKERAAHAVPDPAITAQVAAGLCEIADGDLRDALARLGGSHQTVVSALRPWQGGLPLPHFAFQGSDLLQDPGRHPLEHG